MTQEERDRVFNAWMTWCIEHPMTPHRMMCDKPRHIQQYLEEKCKQEGIPYN